MPLKDDSKTSTRTIRKNASIVRNLFDLFLLSFFFSFTFIFKCLPSKQRVCVWFGGIARRQLFASGEGLVLSHSNLYALAIKLIVAWCVEIIVFMTANKWGRIEDNNSHNSDRCVQAICLCLNLFLMADGGTPDGRAPDRRTDGPIDGRMDGKEAEQSYIAQWISGLPK